MTFLIRRVIENGFGLTAALALSMLLDNLMHIEDLCQSIKPFSHSTPGKLLTKRAVPCPTLSKYIFASIIHRSVVVSVNPHFDVTRRDSTK